jgi:hypothetical protein
MNPDIDPLIPIVMTAEEETVVEEPWWQEALFCLCPLAELWWNWDY